MAATVWFISDLHIGHQLVAGLRGFDDVTAHDNYLAAQWDSCVGDDETIWVLGDISSGGSAAQRNALAWLKNRPGVKHLIAGNHDGIHPMHRDAHKWHAQYQDVFVSVAQSARRRIHGQEVLLNHFPYQGDQPWHRHDQWKLPDYGVPVLHGHTHLSDTESLSLKGTRQIHVGVDAHDFRPVSIEYVRNKLAGSDVVQDGRRIL